MSEQCNGLGWAIEFTLYTYLKFFYHEIVVFDIIDEILVLHLDVFWPGILHHFYLFFISLAHKIHLSLCTVFESSHSKVVHVFCNLNTELL